MWKLKTERLYVYLSYLLLITSLLTGVTFSRYSVTISNVESQNVMTLKTVSGDFDVDIEAVTEELVFDEQKSGMDVQEFEFSVKNNTEEKINATLEMNWQDSNNKMNMPLEFAIYKQDEKIYPKKGNIKTSSIGRNRLKIELGEITEKAEENFVLKWSWEEGDTKEGYVLSGKETEINLKVVVEIPTGLQKKEEYFDIIARSSKFLFNHDGYSQTIGMEDNQAYLDLELSNYIDKDISIDDIEYYISIEDDKGINEKFTLSIDDKEYSENKSESFIFKGGEKEKTTKRLCFNKLSEDEDNLDIVENIRVKITTTKPYVKESIFNVFITNDSLIKFRLEDWITIPLPIRKMKFETSPSYKSVSSINEMTVKITWDKGLDLDAQGRYVKKYSSLEENKDSVINGGKEREFYLKVKANDVVELDFIENGISKEREIDVETFLSKENGKLIHHTDWKFN